MSMNLWMEKSGKDVNLWQTPTHITYMCLMGPKGVQDVVEGPAADRALYCYIAWVMSQCEGVYTNRKEADECRRTSLEEKERVEKFIGKPGVTLGMS